MVQQPANNKGTTLCMGYLDDLSPKKEEEEEEATEVPKTSYSPGANAGGGKTTKKRSGGIPSGRGPMASYLDAMTGNDGNEHASSASSSPFPQQQQEEEEEDFGEGTKKLEKASGWSGAYLDDFLTSEDDSRTDIRNLLTQRSIQSFMFLLEQCRDPHSAKWIQEDFLQTGNLLEYHGTGASFIENFGGTWYAALYEMISRPKSTMIVSAKRRGRGHGGWSKNNPYLAERWVEIPIDIYPASLASRILTVREQISTEWVQDLDVVLAANDLILDSYFAKIQMERERDGGNTGEAIGARTTDIAFERTAIHLMNDNTRFQPTASSPFRRGNFDLLYNLCTQAAVHRILRQQRTNGEEMEVSSVFLRNFYVDRAEEYFDGDLPYGRADDFIDELLQTAPAVLRTNDGKTGFIDPLGAAESIIRMRNEVAMEWKETMARVQEDHTGIRQALLTDSMQYWGGEGEEGISSGSGDDDDGGAGNLSFQ
mmetsp:Transcript_15632/g.22875  ORF Transcript_15632/g.22875 Transcript_15632/m.22875 type:complete len:482 (+) Transcript_15632:842-2287(+)